MSFWFDTPFDQVMTVIVAGGVLFTLIGFYGEWRLRQLDRREGKG